MLIKIINVAKAQGTSKAGKPYSYIDVTYKVGDKTESKKLFLNDPIATDVMSYKNGDTVEMTQAKEGDFWVWKTVSKVDGDTTNSEQQETSTKAAATKSTYIPDDQKQLLIVRQNCVGNAVKYHEGNVSTVHEVLKTASIFENYVFGRYLPPTSPDQHPATTDTDFVETDDEIPF